MTSESTPQKFKPPYPFAPITEAVVEFRFESQLEEGEMTKISGKLAAKYPNEQIQISKAVKFDLDIEGERATANFGQGNKTFRRSNDDQNEIALLGGHSFTISQLALYPSWEQFLDRIIRDREICNKVIGYRKIVQIGMRYINRIDVPFDSDGMARHEDYLTIQVQLPDEYANHIGYNLTVQIPLKELKCVANIQSGAVPSPLPKHVAFILDIDLIRTVDVPQKDDDIYSLLAEMRQAKNSLFEAFITDTARERFYHGQSLQQPSA